MAHSTSFTEPRPATSGITLGSIFGIRVNADPSLLVIFVLIVVSLGSGVLPQWHPEWAAGIKWSVAILAAVLFFASILLHELAHAAVARTQGIPVRSITLFLFGGLAQIEGEPASPSDEFAMAIVGPLTSIAIGVVALVIGGALSASGADAIAIDPRQSLAGLRPLPTLLLWLGPMNLLLGLFNLVPGFPLDGGRVLRALIWWITGSLTRATQVAAAVGQFVAWLFIGAGVLMAFGLRVPLLGVGMFQGLWLVLIGWFMASGARGTLARVIASRALAGVPVRRLMMTRLEALDPDVTVGSFVRDHLMQSHQRCFPVISSNGRFAGLVSPSDVKRVAASAWDALTVAELMTPADRVVSLAPGDDATRALAELARRDVEQVVVLDRGEVVGFVRRRDLVNWMSLTANSAPRSDTFRDVMGRRTHRHA